MRFVATIINGTSESFHSPIVHNTLTVLTAIFSLFTVAANGCTILVLLRHRPMQKSISNLYILSLSCADLAIGFLVLMIAVGRLQSPYIASLTWLCDSWQVADFVLSTTSLCSICAIALDRVWNLEKPLRVFKRSRRLARRLVLAIWLVPILIWIPFYLTVVDSSSLGSVYGFDDCSDRFASLAPIPLVALPLLYFPAVALVAMFCRISIVVHGHLSFLREHSNNPASIFSNTSGKASKDSTPFMRTPEQTKKYSDTSITSVRTQRSRSPCLTRELTPVNEERSSGRERSLSEQLPQFEVDSSNHLRVKSTTSNPTRRESIRARQLLVSQQGDARALQRQSTRRRSKRFSVIAIPSNLTDILQREGVSQQVRAAKAVALILSCFLVCWVPFLVLWPLKLVCRECVPDAVYNVAIWLNYLCSAFNPLLYTLSSPRVRLLLCQYVSCLSTRTRIRQSYYGKSATFV